MMEKIPGIRGLDHVGITVPDLKQAVDFFVHVLGCTALYDLGPFKSDDDWMKEHLNVDPKAEIPKVTMLRCPNGVSFEVFEYKVANQQKAYPSNSDIGGHHLAFYVEDITKGVETLKKNGLKVLGDPVKMTEGPSAGESWVYFLSPWGLQLELTSFPEGKAYEK